MRVGKNDVNRKVFSLKDFRGVDYASSPLEVKPYRATDMANLLLRDGQLQKRYGFKQKFNVGVNPKYGYSQAFPQTFEQVFETRLFKCGANTYGPIMIAQYYETREDVSTFVAYGRDAHNGEIKELGRKEISYASTATSVYDGNKLYLFAGNGIYTTDGTCNNGVLDMPTIIPYVPTTTINIPLMAGRRAVGDEEGFAVFVADSDVHIPYQSNESLNMLTSKRKNSILVKANFDYDNLIGDDDIAVGKKFFKLDGVARMSAVYDAPKLTANVDGVNTEIGEFTLIEENGVKWWVNTTLGLKLYEKRAVLIPNIDKIADTASVLAVDDEDTFKSAIKSSTLQANEYGYITLTLEYEPYFENIADSNEDTTSIYGAKTAITFGVGGADDRIFVGGGGMHPHRVYFSENTSKYQADVTYFPVDQWLECGLSGSPVSAMMKVSDGTLAIFKDVSAYDGVSVYYASGLYESLGTGEEGNEYQRARFTVKSGDIKRSGISAKAVANLGGDNIFTCKEGVYGIQLAENVASGERYARERSRTINPKITQFDLQNARGIVYKDKYFLAVGEGEVYVADARYTFTQKGDQQSTFNYEWFRLTGLNVLEWFIYDDKLHFIDKDGYICEFTDGFADQYLVSSKDNELTAHREDELWVGGGKVTFNSDRLPLIKASSYAIDHLGRTWQLELVDNDTALKIPEGITIADSADLDLWFCVPIAAYWQSAVMDLGTPIYLKNMWSLSMVASAKHGGKINLGYKTRMNSVSNIEVEGANEADFGTMIDNLFGGTQTSLLTGGVNSFGMYTFDVGGYVGINTYRRRLFDRNFAHIQLLFTSETTTDCAVAEMDIEYSISRKNIGVG